MEPDKNSAIEEAFQILARAGYSTVRIVAASIGQPEAGQVQLIDELRDGRKISHAFSAKVWEKFGA